MQEKEEVENMGKKERRVRVLLGKLGLDCHDTGITVMASLLREAGLEVIYMGLHNSAEDLYRTAVQEDVDVVGISFLSGQHLYHTRKFMLLLSRKDRFRVMLGGVIPKADIKELERMGVSRVFLPGTSHQEVLAFCQSTP